MCHNNVQEDVNVEVAHSMKFWLNCPVVILKHLTLGKTQSFPPNEKTYPLVFWFILKVHITTSFPT